MLRRVEPCGDDRALFLGGHLGGDAHDEGDRLERLRAVPLFAGLQDKALKDVLGPTREIEHAGGEILEEGTEASAST